MDNIMTPPPSINENALQLQLQLQEKINKKQETRNNYN